MVDRTQAEGSKELISSKEFPGSIPDLLAVSQKLIDEKPEVAQGLVNTWFDVLDFMEQNPDKELTKLWQLEQMSP